MHSALGTLLLPNSNVFFDTLQRVSKANNFINRVFSFCALSARARLVMLRSYLSTKAMHTLHECSGVAQYTQADRAFHLQFVKTQATKMKFEVATRAPRRV